MHNRRVSAGQFSRLPLANSTIRRLTALSTSGCSDDQVSIRRLVMFSRFKLAGPC